METIKFSHNWNKKLETETFSTIRLENPHKYRLGEVYRIVEEQKGRLIERGQGKLILIETIRIHHLKPVICWLDTGYSLDETRNILYRMYPGKDWGTQNLYYMLIQKVKQTPQNGNLFE